MASNALKRFRDKQKDVQYLLGIHAELTGLDRGKRAKNVEVLNKSAIVFVSALWEAYCEDLLLEAMTFLVENVTSSNSLPSSLRKNVAKSIKPKIQDNIENAWKLVEDWKPETKKYVEDNIRHVNTASSSCVIKLFKDMLDIEDISSSWRWQNMTPEQSRKSLDEYCGTRHKIAHGRPSRASIKKKHATSFFQLTQKLAEVTETVVHSQVQEATGKHMDW